MKKKDSEFKNFESALGKVLSVSRDELKKREEQWRSERGKKKARKSKIYSPSREANDRV